jgi:hypothetical protein
MFKLVAVSAEMSVIDIVTGSALRYKNSAGYISIELKVPNNAALESPR